MGGGKAVIVFEIIAAVLGISMLGLLLGIIVKPEVF